MAEAKKPLTECYPQSAPKQSCETEPDGHTPLHELDHEVLDHCFVSRPLFDASDLPSNELCICQRRSDCATCYDSGSSRHRVQRL